MLEKFKDSVKDFSSSVKSKVAEKELDEDTLNPLLEDLRLKLLQNNVSLEAAEAIEEELREELLGQEVSRSKVQETVEEAMKEVLMELLDDSFDLEQRLDEAEDPPVVFFVGFNGSGKTTSVAKIANKLSDRGVVMGAGDTFRAASIEQLEEH
ncbi:MAG: signal recognition particle receptor subunit alpha, partial [Candidatus Nanohaloarchaea archaeon]